VTYTCAVMALALTAYEAPSPTDAGRQESGLAEEVAKSNLPLAEKSRRLASLIREGTTRGQVAKALGSASFEMNKSGMTLVWYLKYQLLVSYTLDRQDPDKARVLEITPLKPVRQK
jgi:hypothetical protein